MKARPATEDSQAVGTQVPALQVVRPWAPVRDGNTSLRILKQTEQLDGP